MDEKVLVKGNAMKSVPAILIVVGLILGIGVSYLVEWYISDDYMVLFIMGCGAFLTIWGIVLFFYASCEICVTDRLIYGKTAFGARVAIPIDSVSAVGTISLVKGIFVGSSSGRIKFLCISNSEKIYRIISDILIKRQTYKR